ncbi:hypothetical protein GGI07_000036 [Coemansia sp. Benny D115]|nr:hypothetical protein GGI07_000036 [Coemansia sp. Benny D115]
MEIDTPTTASFTEFSQAKRQRTSSISVDNYVSDKGLLAESVPKWQEVSEGAFCGIVSIRFNQPVNFDTCPPMCSEATGFIVDAERGIILTNRHVVGAGPFVGEAIMHDHEEVSVKAIYRDPIHDFGFLQFDPSEIKYMKLVELRLAPENARVGIDVRVIGNDAGEKLSILAGSISRVDRNVPEYGMMTYNDLNTFYLQAASSLSGGSSGSPVIDINGDAVALQAGGRTEEATNFFLPLDRVKRALELIQAGKPVLRGTIQTQFMLSPFDETRRLGLPDETEDMVRRLRPETIGMLTVRCALPGGPGDVAGIQEGDVLISINGEVVTHFVPLEEFMDDNIGGTLAIQVARAGKILDLNVSVQDMHALTPSKYVTFGDTVVHDFSYQLAYSHNLPVKGVFVAWAGLLFESHPDSEGIMISSIDSIPIDNIDGFVSIMKNVPDRSHISLEYYKIDDIHTKIKVVAYIMHSWQKLRVYTRNDSTGLWDIEKIEMVKDTCKLTPTSVKFPIMNNAHAGKAAAISKSIVNVRAILPACIDGMRGMCKYSCGVVVDKEQGLVVTSQRTVTVGLCELTITVAGSCIIPAKLRFLHPTLNFAIIQYDPKHIADTDIQAIKISPEPLRPGDSVRMITLSMYSNPLCINTIVSETVPLNIGVSIAPRWRSINAESILLESPQAKKHAFGVLADEDGLVQGLWLDYMLSDNKKVKFEGLSIKSILPALEPFWRGEEPKLRSLNVEVSMMSISKAVTCGLSAERVKEYQEVESSRNIIYQIDRVESLSKADGVLKELDIIVSVNGKPMKSIDVLDVQYTQEKLDIVVLRQKKEISLQVMTTECNQGTSKVVFWAGATLQAPHKAVLQQSRVVPSGVYCASTGKGSPAEMYGLCPTFWVTHVNDRKVEDLDSFADTVATCADHSYVRIKVVTFDQIPIILTIKMCYHYWPTSSLTKSSQSTNEWTSKAICGALSPDLGVDEAKLAPETTTTTTTTTD